VIDNEHYSETGMQPTHTGRGVSLAGVAAACNFASVKTIYTEEELNAALAPVFAGSNLMFCDIKVNTQRYPMSIRLRDGAHIKNRFRENLLGQKAFDYRNAKRRETKPWMPSRHLSRPQDVRRRAWVDAAQRRLKAKSVPGKPWALIPRAGAADADRAVRAAHKAFTGGDWPKMTASQRGALLRQLGDLIVDKAKHLAEIEVRDSKLISEMGAQTA
jgi:hypothetical protein